MAFNTEDKITLNDLAPSLQNLLIRAVKKSEIIALQKRVDKLQSLLSGIKFSIVNSFDEVLHPENGKEIVLKFENNEYKMFIYINNQWTNVPLSSDINVNLSYIVTVKQSANQIISVNYNDSVYTSNFKAQGGSKITFDVKPNKGYIAGNLNITSPQTISKNLIISASEATEMDKYNVIVNTYVGQSIYVEYNNKSYKNKSVIGVYEGDPVTITIRAEEGFNVGTLSINGDYTIDSKPNTYLVSGDIVVTATEAIRNNYNINIPPTTNQTIRVNYTNITTGNSGYMESGTAYKQLRLPYGSEYTVSVTADSGFNAGRLSTTGGVLKGNINISISNASRKTYNVKLPITTNQTITFTYIDYNTSTSVSTVSKSNADVNILNIPNESSYSITISAITGYNTGTVNVPMTGTITGNLNVTITDVTPKNYTLTITQAANQTVKAKLPSGTILSSTSSVPYKQLFTPVITGNTGYNAGTPNVTGNFEVANSTQYRILGNTTLTANAAIPKKYNLSIVQSANQTIKVKLLPQNTTMTVTSLVDYNQEFSVEVIPSTGYDAGIISMSGNFETISTNRYRFKTDCTIIVSEAVRTGVTITLPKTTNQILKVNYTNPNNLLVGIVSSSTTQQVQEVVPYNSTFTTLVEPNSGYKAGTASPASGTLTANRTFSVTAATLL